MRNLACPFGRKGVSFRKKWSVVYLLNCPLYPPNKGVSSQTDTRTWMLHHSASQLISSVGVGTIDLFFITPSVLCPGTSKTSSRGGGSRQVVWNPSMHADPYDPYACTHYYNSPTKTRDISRHFLGAEAQTTSPNELSLILVPRWLLFGIPTGLRTFWASCLSLTGLFPFNPRLKARLLAV